MDLDLRRVVNRISDAYVALDTAWRYTHVNDKAAQLLGRAPEDLLGRNIWEVFTDEVATPFREAYQRAMVLQQAGSFEGYFPPLDRWLETRMYPAPDGMTIYFLDITQRKRDEMMEAGQRAILAAVAAQQPLAESLRRIACLHEQLNPGALCSVLLLDAIGQRLRHGAAPSLPEAFTHAIDGHLVGDGRGSCATAVSRREPVIVVDIATHPYWADFKLVALEHGLRACWSMPVLNDQGRVLGTFAVYYRDVRQPHPAELEGIRRMLPLTAVAIESAQLITRLRERDVFFDLSQEIYCVFDPAAGRIVQVNPAFSLTTGFSEAELCAVNYLDFVHADDRDLATSAVAVLDAAGKRVSNVTFRFLCTDGGYRWLSWESVVAPDGFAYAVGHDLTEQRQVEQDLAFASNHDAVTGLPNHVVLERALATLLEQEMPVWVLFVGLDRFGSINESMGHVIGDEVLARIAKRLLATLGLAGHIARFAGDEFVIAMATPVRDDVLALAEALRHAVAQPIEGRDYRLRLTATIGISHSPAHGQSPHELLRRAEAAMSLAKRQGRDTVCEFSVEQMRDIEDRLLLGRHLRDAINADELVLHYQPQHRASDRRLSGFEALLRWNSPALGPVSPGVFIPVAEALGLMGELGAWVVDAACRQARAWLDLGHGDFNIAVNISAQQLQRPGLVDVVRTALQDHGVPARMLSIELTESSLMENVSRVRSTLGQLRALGLTLSLDDFGTGYSSLAYLKQFPIDKLKIDQSFVRGLPHDADDAAIARTIVAMAHQLRMLVAAEGIETQDQADFLNGIGCDELQGFFFGRPVPAQQALALLQRAGVAEG